MCFCACQFTLTLFYRRRELWSFAIWWSSISSSSNLVKIFPTNQSYWKRFLEKILRPPGTVFGTQRSGPSVFVVLKQITKIVHACNAAVDTCTLLACSKFFPMHWASGPAPIAELSYNPCKCLAFLVSCWCCKFAVQWINSEHHYSMRSARADTNTLYLIKLHMHTYI